MVFNWLHAKRHRGQLLLRIDDTDPTRDSDDYAERLTDLLEWLGLSWDEGPTRQSRRAEGHRAAAEELLDAGKAYRDFSPGLVRSPGQRAYRPKHWRDLGRPESDERAERGEAFSLRLRVDGRRASVSFDDRVFGVQECPRSKIEDLVLLRADGSPTYHLATVCDDTDDGITLVMRGQEHIASTVRQLLVYEAFGMEPPEFAHLPLLIGRQGRELTAWEQKGSLEDFREANVLSSALRNQLALLGWSPPHRQQVFLDDEKLASVFDLGRVSRAPVRFDEDKLMELNRLHLHDLPAEKVVPAVKAELERRSRPAPWAEQEHSVEMALFGVDLARADASTVGELVDQSSGLLGEDYEIDRVLLERVCAKLPVTEIVDQLLVLLGSSPPASWEEMHRSIVEMVRGRDLSSREVILVLRVALVGRSDGPPVKGVFQLLGPARVEERLRALTQRCGCEMFMGSELVELE